MGEKSTIELSDTKRRSVGLGSAADEVVAIRQLWERMANRALENAGSDARIDSRSLKAQGLDREATMHLGPVASDMEQGSLRLQIARSCDRVAAETWI
ncbi:Mobilization protein [Pseudomonas amygdali pv. morsprunorum]|uniref:MobA/MobL family protein n=1 Tax=Pseudomonas amygdali TaxID=47877 RepID=UPI0006B93222|nr:MobA/MobL family protein [Pseudomonas amygdali]KPC58184.1 Mobilization protein [Pseudomonas amygdali pv. morsprunorum]